MLLLHLLAAPCQDVRRRLVAPVDGPDGCPWNSFELVAELKTMPDVEVSTYLHQSWPSLVEDIDRQAPGTHTVVVGYSLGANSSVFVANKVKYVDLIIALQPSMLSWNPPVTGKVGRMIEIYNPNPWMTFGGMGSKKLIGENIEYIANYDSHPGAQFNSEFRSLVKSEIAKFSSDGRLEAAKAVAPQPNKLAKLPQSARLKPTEEQLTNRQTANDFAQRLGAVDDEQPTDRRSSPRSIRLSISAWTTAVFSVALSTRPSGCLSPLPSMSRAVTSTRSLPICRPSIWIISRSTLDKVGCHPLGQALGRQRYEPARGRRFRGASPAMGSRTALLSLRVDTLILVRPTKAKSHTFRLRHEILSTPTAAYSSPTTFPICFA